MEKYSSKISGRFDSRGEAESAAGQLRQDPLLPDSRIEVIRPGDAVIGRKIQPESREVRNSLLRQHVIFGAAGLVLGVVLGAVLIASGRPVFALSPFYVMLVTVFFGTIAGLLFGGLVSLRPDQGKLAAQVQDEVKSGYWVVVAHTVDEKQTMAAQETFDRLGAKTHQTL